MAAHLLLQLTHLGLGQGVQATTLQPRRQRDRTKTDAHQPRNGQPHGIEEPPHLTVAPFQNHHPIPVIGTFAADILDGLQRGRTILQRHASQQLLADLVIHPSQHPHRVLTLPAIAGMHQLVGQIARRGEDQQTLTVQIQPSHGNPARPTQTGQAVEDLRPRSRIITRDQLAGRFVVEQHLRRLRGRAALARQRLAVHADDVLGSHPLAHMGWQTVHGHPSGDDQLLHVTARTDAGIRQDLVELLGVGRHRPPGTPTRIAQTDAGLAGKERHRLPGHFLAVILVVEIVLVVVPVVFVAEIIVIEAVLVHRRAERRHLGGRPPGIHARIVQGRLHIAPGADAVVRCLTHRRHTGRRIGKPFLGDRHFSRRHILDRSNLAAAGRCPGRPGTTRLGSSPLGIGRFSIGRDGIAYLGGNARLRRHRIRRRLATRAGDPLGSLCCGLFGRHLASTFRPQHALGVILRSRLAAAGSGRRRASISSIRLGSLASRSTLARRRRLPGGRRARVRLQHRIGRCTLPLMGSIALHVFFVLFGIHAMVTSQGVACGRFRSG